VTVHRENVYSWNLVRFKEKVHTLVRIKGNVTSFVPSLLIKLSQLSPRRRKPSLSRTT